MLLLMLIGDRLLTNDCSIHSLYQSTSLRVMCSPPCDSTVERDLVHQSIPWGCHQSGRHPHSLTSLSWTSPRGLWHWTRFEWSQAAGGQLLLSIIAHTDVKRTFFVDSIKIFWCGLRLHISSFRTPLGTIAQPLRIVTCVHIAIIIKLIRNSLVRTCRSTVWCGTNS